MFDMFSNLLGSLTQSPVGFGGLNLAAIMESQPYKTALGSIVGSPFGFGPINLASLLFGGGANNNQERQNPFMFAPPLTPIPFSGVFNTPIANNFDSMLRSLLGVSQPNYPVDNQPFVHPTNPNIGFPGEPPNRRIGTPGKIKPIEDNRFMLL